MYSHYFLQSLPFQGWLTEMPHTNAVKYFVNQSAIYPEICLMDLTVLLVESILHEAEELTLSFF
jgi:hypothetical protein